MQLVVHSSPERLQVKTNYLKLKACPGQKIHLHPDFLTRNENVQEFQIHGRSDHSNMCSFISPGDKIDMTSYIKLL